ncbi:hypothetical protein BGW37DRAFT_528124 [Umbelopsis sp. PMI_123]|nr:hypothetical protein BGW37DRAFT_528124 [Umbelopsis sp. PMI_123]
MEALSISKVQCTTQNGVHLDGYFFCLTNQINSFLPSLTALVDAIALTKCELETANHSLPPVCAGATTEQELLQCVASLAQIPQWWTSYSGYLRQVVSMCYAMRHSIERDIMERLHRNITVNQLINYDILRQQQNDLILRQKKEQDSMQRIQCLQNKIERSMKENHEYSKRQSNELIRAQNEVMSLQSIISQITNEYSKAIDLIVDIAVQKMKVVSDKEDLNLNHALSDLEVYTSVMMDVVEEAGNMHYNVYSLMERLESHEEQMLQGMEDSIAKVNETVKQMTEGIVAQLQQTYGHSNLFSFNWFKSPIRYIEHGFTLSIHRAISVTLTVVTPFVILLQGLRSEFIWYMLTTIWLSIWLQISSNILGCILVYIVLHVRVTSLAEGLVWLWIAQTITPLRLEY